MNVVYKIDFSNLSESEFQIRFTYRIVFSGNIHGGIYIAFAKRPPGWEFSAERSQLHSAALHSRVLIGEHLRSFLYPQRFIVTPHQSSTPLPHQSLKPAREASPAAAVSASFSPDVAVALKNAV